MSFALAACFMATYLMGPLVAFGVITGQAAFVSVEALGFRRWPNINAKDAGWLLYAVLAIPPTIATGSVYELTYYVRIVILPWLISYAMQNVSWTPLRVRSAIMGMSLVATVAAAIMVFQIAPGEFDISLRRLLTLDRQLGFYFLGPEPAGPNGVSFMAAAGIACALAYLKFFNGASLVTYAIFLVNVTFLLVAGGRNAWVSAGALLVLFAFAGRTRLFSLRSLAIGAVALTLSAVVVALLLRGLLGQHGYALQDRILGLANPAEDRNAVARLVYWTLAVDMIAARPSGWGFNAYYARYDITPHNELLAQLVGGGVLGAIGFVIVMILIGVRLARLLLRPDPLAWRQAAHYTALSLFGVAVLGMVTEHISRVGMATFYPLLWIAVGMSYSTTRGGSDIAAGGPRRPLDSIGMVP